MTMQRMSYAEYLTVPGVRFSHLKKLRTSELHYRHAVSEDESESTPSTSLGTAAHAAIFEPELFEAEYVVCDLNRNSNDWKAFKAEHDPEKILKSVEREAALRIAEAVRSNPQAAEILGLPGQSEQVLTWIDPETGIQRKARLDWVTPPDVGVLADLKTAADIGEMAFGRAAGKFCYHGQAVDYTGGLYVETGAEYRPTLIVVENKPPFDVGVLDVIGAEFDAGLRLVRDLHDRLAKAMASGSWPGQYPQRSKLNLPSWELFEDNDISDLGMNLEVRGAAA
jgi:hypothetical protein